ncbi:hypothetical protein LRY65_03020 [Candidatus Woesebacteria bacterium]|nr:hypothetical protein [Candidatus Woesebacteria bacterium]MCD8507371.1 hypothetical protein [Candidatus Woesebacteria bacterium]MCD8527160.1 hypothetical protein [Candidatus Woesebacteria bacterium]MCD8546803.1 hypothetical protein [Candidatus Woesebacteria bacterium]
MAIFREAREQLQSRWKLFNLNEAERQTLQSVNPIDLIGKKQPDIDWNTLFYIPRSTALLHAAQNEFGIPESDFLPAPQISWSQTSQKRETFSIRRISTLSSQEIISPQTLATLQEKPEVYKECIPLSYIYTMEDTSDELQSLSTDTLEPWSIFLQGYDLQKKAFRRVSIIYIPFFAPQIHVHLPQVLSEIRERYGASYEALLNSAKIRLGTTDFTLNYLENACLLISELEIPNIRKPKADQKRSIALPPETAGFQLGWGNTTR